jgi:hypothetical protein
VDDHNSSLCDAVSVVDHTQSKNRKKDRLLSPKDILMFKTC